VAGSVRDRGLAVAYTDNTDGTFNLSASPAGIVTCDVLTRGPAATYQASDLIAKLIDGYTSLDYPTNYAGNITPDTFPGPSSTLFGPGDFEIGVRVEEKSNTLEVLNSMCVLGHRVLHLHARQQVRVWPHLALHRRIGWNPVMSFTADDMRGLPKLTHGDPTLLLLVFLLQQELARDGRGRLCRRRHDHHQGAVFRQGRVRVQPAEPTRRGVGAVARLLRPAEPVSQDAGRLAGNRDAAVDHSTQTMHCCRTTRSARAGSGACATSSSRGGSSSRSRSGSKPTR
jgi:hypothetical protein